MGLSVILLPASARSNHFGSHVCPLSRVPLLQYVHSIKPLPPCQYPLTGNFKGMCRSLLLIPITDLPEPLGERSVAVCLGISRHHRFDLFPRTASIDIGKHR